MNFPAPGLRGKEISIMARLVRSRTTWDPSIHLRSSFARRKSFFGVEWAKERHFIPIWHSVNREGIKCKKERERCRAARGGKLIIDCLSRNASAELMTSRTRKNPGGFAAFNEFSPTERKILQTSSQLLNFIADGKHLKMQLDLFLKARILSAQLYPSIGLFWFIWFSTITLKGRKIYTISHKPRFQKSVYLCLEKYFANSPFAKVQSFRY